MRGGGAPPPTATRVCVGGWGEVPPEPPLGFTQTGRGSVQEKLIQALVCAHTYMSFGLRTWLGIVNYISRTAMESTS